MASSMEHGKDLPSVQLLMKKNQVRRRLRAKEKFPRVSPHLDLYFSLRQGFSGSSLMLCTPRPQWLAFPHLSRVGSLGGLRGITTLSWEEGSEGALEGREGKRVKGVLEVVQV